MKTLTAAIYSFFKFIYFKYIILLLTILDSFNRNQVLKVTYTIHNLTKKKYIYMNVKGTELIESLKYLRHIQLHKIILNIFFQYYTIEQIVLITFMCI